jgi:hypothetical protein
MYLRVTELIHRNVLELQSTNSFTGNKLTSFRSLNYIFWSMKLLLFRESQIQSAMQLRTPFLGQPTLVMTIMGKP